MDSSRSWAPTVAEVLGQPTDVRALGGTVWRATVGDRRVVVKQGPGAAEEAAGLRALADVEGAPPVPEVLHQGEHLLVTSWVPTGRRSPTAETGLGHALAHLHRAPQRSWVAGPPPSARAGSTRPSTTRRSRCTAPA